MKFIEITTLLISFGVFGVFSVAFGQDWNQILQSVRNQHKRSQNNCKFPLFSCRLYNRFWSTKRETGFPITPQTSQAFPSGVYGQESSAYPSYALPVYTGSSYLDNQNQNYGQQNSIDEYPMPSQAIPQYIQYPPKATYTSKPYGQSHNSVDVHQVLDQLIRSAGLSPQGDHQSESAHSSSFAKAGTSPVFVFKKLFSFPFYLSSDPNVVDLYGKGWK